jgi:hypothetical protein
MSEKPMDETLKQGRLNCGSKGTPVEDVISEIFSGVNSCNEQTRELGAKKVFLFQPKRSPQSSRLASSAGYRADPV